MQQISTWKETSKELQWVPVVLIIQHAKRMHHILFVCLEYRNIPQIFTLPLTGN